MRRHLRASFSGNLQSPSPQTPMQRSDSRPDLWIILGVQTKSGSFFFGVDELRSDLQPGTCLLMYWRKSCTWRSSPDPVQVAVRARTRRWRRWFVTRRSTTLATAAEEAPCPSASPSRSSNQDCTRSVGPAGSCRTWPDSTHLSLLCPPAESTHEVKASVHSVVFHRPARRPTAVT